MATINGSGLADLINRATSRTNDFINGNNGDDVIISGSGSDTIFGGGGNDAIHGGAGKDSIDGGKGNDNLFGGDDADQLLGNVGDDILDGGTGNDNMSGGIGADRITGGGGGDTMAASSASTEDSSIDVFVYNSLLDSKAGTGLSDFITGFTDGQDKIDLSAIDTSPFLAGNQAFSFGSGFMQVQLNYDIPGGGEAGVTATHIDINTDFDAAIEFRIDVSGLVVEGDFIL